MKMEIAAPLGKVYATSASAAATTLAPLSGSSAAPLLKNRAKPGAGNLPPQFAPYTGFNDVFAADAAPKIPLNRADEIKIAAFRSLLAADSKRATETLGELFNRDSEASGVFRQEALRVLRRPRLSPTSNRNFTFSTGSERINKNRSRGKFQKTENRDYIQWRVCGALLMDDDL